MKRILYFDWPDIPFLDFPDLPSPGSVLENLFETLTSAMRDDGIDAIESVIRLLSKPGPIDFREEWLQLAFSKIYGLALGLTVIVATVIVIIRSLSKRIDTVTRIIDALSHIVRMLIAGYVALTLFAGILYLAGLLTTLFAGVVSIGDSSGTIDSAFDFADVGSLFGALATAGMLMGAGGFLYVQVQAFEFMLAPLALMSLLAYAIKPMGVWGERFWKLFVSYVFAVAFTKPAVVLILGITTQIVTNAPGMPPTIENLFLLFAVWACSFVPLLIMVLAYVGYTIQLGKSKSEVEGRVQIMSPQMQNALYGQQLMERMRSALATSESKLRTTPGSRPQRSHIMRDHVRATAYSAADMKISAGTAFAARKVAATVGGPAGAVAAVVVTGAGKVAQNKLNNSQNRGGGNR